MNKKGQAAMEFLMTYGWAILVVIAAIAVLAASGLLDLSRYMPERCDFPIDFPCKGKASVRSSGLQVTLLNSLDTAINVNSVSITGTCTGQPYVAATTSGYMQNASWGNLSVPMGEILRVQINCTLTTGAKFDEDLSVVYSRSDNSVEYTATGDIKTKTA